MNYITLIYPNKVKRIEYTDTHDLLCKIERDLYNQIRFNYKYPHAIIRFPDATYKEIHSSAIEWLYRRELKGWSYRCSVSDAIYSHHKNKLKFHKVKYRDMLYLDFEKGYFRKGANSRQLHKSTAKMSREGWEEYERRSLEQKNLIDRLNKSYKKHVNHE